MSTILFNPSKTATPKDREVEDNASVVSVPQLATFAPDKRELLEKILGPSMLESALLALAPGYTWWTDDFVASEVGKAELNVERVWTQAVVEHVANLGLIDRRVADEAYARLVGFDYRTTYFTSTIMVAALRVSNGSVDATPMRQMIRAFEPMPLNDCEGALRLLAEFILKVTMEPLLPETKCIATRAFLDTFPNDAQTTALLKSVRLQCGRLMTLNPVGQADFLGCFDQWNKDRLKQRYLVTPSSS